jgi:hypothetical protein
MNWLSFIKNNFTLFVILILAAIILMQRVDIGIPGITKTKPKQVKIDGVKYNVLKHDTITTEIPVYTTVYKPGNTITCTTTVYQPVPENVDTSAILAAYYQLKVYKDTLKIKDTLGYVSVIDSISKNSIVSRKYDAMVKKYIVKEIIVVEKPAVTQVYGGGMIGLQWPNKTLVVGPTAILKTKKDQMYGIQAGVSFNAQPYVAVSSLWKISAKKK